MCHWRAKLDVTDVTDNNISCCPRPDPDKNDSHSTDGSKKNSIHSIFRTSLHFRTLKHKKCWQRVQGHSPSVTYVAAVCISTTFMFCAVGFKRKFCAAMFCAVGPKKKFCAALSKQCRGSQGKTQLCIWQDTTPPLWKFWNFPVFFHRITYVYMLKVLALISFLSDQ